GQAENQEQIRKSPDEDSALIWGVGSAQAGTPGAGALQTPQEQPGLMLTVLPGIWGAANFGHSCLHHATQELRTQREERTDTRGARTDSVTGDQARKELGSELDPEFGLTVSTPSQSPTLPALLCPVCDTSVVMTKAAAHTVYRVYFRLFERPEDRLNVSGAKMNAAVGLTLLGGTVLHTRPLHQTSCLGHDNSIHLAFMLQARVSMCVLCTGLGGVFDLGCRLSHCKATMLTCREVECGANRALLYVRKLCQGSKGPSICHRGEWLTPNEFQFVSGRETAKDWKRSIRHKGAAAVGARASPVPPLCSPRTRDPAGASSDLRLSRLSNILPGGEMREKSWGFGVLFLRYGACACPTFSTERLFSPTPHGQVHRSGPACGQRLGLKQENDPHVRIMKRRCFKGQGGRARGQNGDIRTGVSRQLKATSGFGVHTHWDVNISFRETSCRHHLHGAAAPPECLNDHRVKELLATVVDGDLPTLISSVHRSRHLVMPEHQSRCEFQRGGVEVGLGAAGDLLGKRLGRSPHITSDCPLEKKARSKSPQGALERKGDSLDPLQGRVSTAAGSKRGAPASPPRLYLKGKTPLLCLPNTEGLLLPELGPGMAPEDHYRRLVSALSEAGTFEDPQRLYHLGLPGHGCGRHEGLVGAGLWVTAGACPSSDLLRVRQEVAAAAVRSPSGLEVFREQGIDGETLPLLTEEHLLTTMGLKLGPALKIRAQVSAYWGQQSPDSRGAALRLCVGLQAPAPSPYGGAQPPAGRASPKQENGTMALLPGPADPSQPLC
ncbi:hypothetical protein E2I00_015822, partial [Balaenoptera physalus]